MFIKKIAFGNSEEAFIEDRLTNGVNIIYSDDNNKGKTLLFQALMYSIGNTPIFPSNFKKENYYFYSMINSSGTDYEFLRRKNTFIVRFLDKLHIFESHSELKKFFNKEHIFDIPTIKKNNRERIVDLELFYELFFVGQDKRNPSNIVNRGLYNKDDFFSMILAIKGYSNIRNSQELEEIKDKIKTIQDEIKVTKQYMQLLKTDKQISSYIDKFTSSEEFKLFQLRSKKLNEKIGEIKRDRNREQNRQDNLSMLLKELNSLNREIQTGSIYCMDCGSTHISFKNRDVNFDLSNKIVRSQIINSIESQIQICRDTIRELSVELASSQDELKTLLRDTPDNLKKSLLYSEIINTDIDYDNELYKLTNLLESLQDRKLEIENSDLKNSKIVNEIKQTIVKNMNNLYKKIDPEGKLIFDDIFTKKDTTYSGSDEQVYYFCRLISLNDLLQHSYPIINDSFRDGEISTKKETLMIEHFKKLNKQVLLSATLKEEEYSNNKYANISDIKVIDYSDNNDSKILNFRFTERFTKILQNFHINF